MFLSMDSSASYINRIQPTIPQSALAKDQRSIFLLFIFLPLSMRFILTVRWRAVMATIFPAFFRLSGLSFIQLRKRSVEFRREYVAIFIKD